MKTNNFSFDLPKSNLTMIVEEVRTNAWMVHIKNRKTSKITTIDQEYSGKQVSALCQLAITAAQKYGIYGKKFRDIKKNLIKAIKLIN